MRTCCRCKVEKEDGEFYSTMQRNMCKPCYRTTYAEYQAARQARSLGTANAHYQRWSELEIEVLLEGVEEGMHIADLAMILERTYYAVASKLRDMRRMGGCDDVAQETKPVHPARDRNYVASAPDEDRWWEPAYYKGEQKDA